MLFRKKKPTAAPRVIAFVDYEHWYISMTKRYGEKPDIKAWRDELSSRYQIVDILFFGDFSNPSLRSEISRIREVSNTIIDTQNASLHYKKDFTDFIMLDHIYQRAFDAKPEDAFVIFSGDGHFSSVVSYLVTKCRREVGIWGVRGAVSAQLKGSATYWVELPTEEAILLGYQKALCRKVAQLCDARRRPTFRATAEKIAEECEAPLERIEVLLNDLLEKEIIFQKRVYIRGKGVKVLDIDREKARKQGLLE